jgi:hypothetical protein
MNATDGTIRRLVPLATWQYQNRHVMRVWTMRSPNMSGPESLLRWLGRHEARLTEGSAVMRLGNAWRLIEPGFSEVMRSILAEERARAKR